MEKGESGFINFLFSTLHSVVLLFCFEPFFAEVFPNRHAEIDDSEEHDSKGEEKEKAVDDIEE